MRKICLFLHIIPWLIAITHTQVSAQSGNGLLQRGEWYKIGVPSQGIFKLDSKFFQDNGINIQGKDSRNFRIFGFPGGVFPQANNASWPESLTEVPIFVSGEDDGSFDANDLLIFYAQGPHSLQIDIANQAVQYDHNPYTDVVYYLLNVGSERGKRIQSQNSVITGTQLRSFWDAAVYTRPQNNILFSGRNWYSERFDISPNRNFTINMPGVVAASSLKLKVEVLGQSFGPSSFQVNMNSQALGTFSLPAISTETYAIKGIEVAQEFTVNQSVLGNTNEGFRINLNFLRFTGGGSNAFLKQISILAQRELKVYPVPVIGQIASSDSHLLISGASANTMVWDVSSWSNVKALQGSLQSGSLNVGKDLTTSKIAIFQPENLPFPAYEGRLNPQNLRAGEVPNLLIITHSSLRNEAERLAAHRRSFSGLKVRVVSVDEIYNEFSAGRQDVSAIRNFIRYSWEQGNRSTLKSVLMFGRASFDYKNRLITNTNLVPNYQSRNSLHPLLTYASDDFFGFLEPQEGEWPEDQSGSNHSLDVAIGRLPAKNAQEARQLVNKLIAYDTEPNTLGPWRNRLLFVADDEDSNIHQRDADFLATLVDTTYKTFNTSKIYLDAYPKINSSVGVRVPAGSKALMEEMERGALIVNYTGHGSERLWAAERLLDDDMIRAMRNLDKLPIVVTATCEFGRNDDPTIISGAELFLLNPNGGGIALVTTTRPVFSSTNYFLNLLFYQNVFERDNGNWRNLGEIFRRTKNASQSGVLNRNFILLGDPSMMPAFPKQEIAITNISNTGGGSIIKALEQVSLNAEIRNYFGNKIGDFDGEAELLILDAPVQKQTLGQGATAFRYKERSNILFRGKANVKNGSFSLSFIPPTDLGELIRLGRIKIYASAEGGMADAAGVKADFIIGGLSANPLTDNQPPQIRLYMNDTTFSDGGATDQNPNLIAILKDNLGIYLSDANPAKQLRAILDGEREILLNRYFVADKDKPNQGRLEFPFFGLSEGPHQLKLMAWDINHNAAESILNFVVRDNTEVKISDVISYPNPFSDWVWFQFEHNRAGEPLAVNLEVYSGKGEFVYANEFRFETSPKRIVDLEWDGRNRSGAKLSPGVYICILRVISLRDGSQTQIQRKLLIFN
jgi:hypothetical protein